MRLPRLLDSSFAEVRRLQPTELSADIQMTPLSTASMKLPEGDEAIPLRAWVEVFAGDESLGVFRVASVDTGFCDGQTIALEHALATLGDSLTAAETTLTGTARAVVNALLSYQGTAYWQRGSVPNAGSYSLEVDRSNVLTALLDLVKQMDGYRIVADFSTSPWGVSIVAMEEAPSCECRLSRNALGVKIALDDSELCTRVYAVGLDGGYMDADTIATWGVIGRTLGTNAGADAAKVRAFAAKFLGEHKNPRVSIGISAVDLSARTGEPLDALRVGKLCRVALPDWGTVTDQRVVSASYPNLLSSPERVDLTLVNAPRDLSRSLAQINADLYGTSTVSRRGGGGGGGASGKGSLETYNTRIERNKDDIQLRAWASTVDEQGQAILQNEAGLLLTAQCLFLGYGAGSLEDLRDGLVDGTYLKIDGDGATLRSKLADAESAITVQSGQIELKVSKNGVISAIRQTPETIQIQARRIDLSGYVTASTLSAEIASLESTFSENILTSYIGASEGRIVTLTVVGDLSFGGHAIGKTTKTVMTNVALSNMQYATVLDVNGNRQFVLTTLSLNKTTSGVSYLSY